MQDCNNHAIGVTHAITDGDKYVEITSTHHQMQYPFNLPNKDYDILYYTHPRRAYYYEGDGIGTPNVEPEIVKYHVNGNPISLAIQGHPEYMRKESPIIPIINELLQKCLTDVQ